MIALIFCVAAYGDSTTLKNQANPEPPAHTRKEYGVQSILFSVADRKLYVFGHMETHPEGDHMPITEEPKIVRLSEDGKVEEKIHAAYFGLEHYSKEEHKHDANTRQTWFVDPVRQQFLRFSGNPGSASAEFSRLLKPAQNLEIFSNLAKMPNYGFLVSITQAQNRIWVTTRTGGGGPYAWARDEMNGILWEGDEGVLKIYSDGTAQPTIVRQHDFVSAIFPDERDGTAWVYFSHQKGELHHIDRTGRTLNTLPLIKFRGTKTPILMDLRRDALWYADTNYPFQLVKMSLAGVRLLEITEDQIRGSGSRRGCFQPKLSLQETDGAIWLYCKGLGLNKIDFSGKTFLKVPSDF